MILREQQVSSKVKDLELLIGILRRGHVYLEKGTRLYEATLYDKLKTELNMLRTKE